MFYTYGPVTKCNTFLNRTCIAAVSNFHIAYSKVLIAREKCAHDGASPPPTMAIADAGFHGSRRPAPKFS